MVPTTDVPQNISLVTLYGIYEMKFYNSFELAVHTFVVIYTKTIDLLCQIVYLFVKRTKNTIHDSVFDSTVYKEIMKSSSWCIISTYTCLNLYNLICMWSCKPMGQDSLNHMKQHARGD